MSLAGRHVAVIADCFPSLMNTYILKHLVALKEAGLRLTIISTGLVQQGGRGHPAIAAHRLEDHVRYLNLNSPWRCARQVAALCWPDYSPRRVLPYLPRLIGAEGWRRHGAKQLLKRLAKLKVVSDGPFDLVHSHYLAGSYEYLFLKEVFGAPLVTSFHGWSPVGVTALAAAKSEEVFAASDMVITNTAFSAGQLRDLGCPAEKIEILPTGLSLEEFPFRERAYPRGSRLVLLSVARLSAEKGLDYAVEAAAELARGGLRDFEYRIVGGGPEAPRLQALIARRGLQGRVRLLGPATTPEVVAQHHQAHLLLVPSVSIPGQWQENQCVVIQEANATGLPVIASRTGGIPEVMREGKTGLLVEERNPQALARAVKCLIDDHDLARRLARAGRRHVEENFDQRRVDERLFALYEALLAPGATRAAAARTVSWHGSQGTSQHPSPY